jgi:N-6 DNA Methylase
MDDFLERLGYSASKTFIRPSALDELPANELTFALRLAALESPKFGQKPSEVRFDGAYVLQRDRGEPAVPAVYVIHTDDEATARRIHQFVWNQNQAPFLILESPASVRVYPGFAYSRTHDNPLFSVARDAVELYTRLEAFRASSIDDGQLWEQWGHAVNPSRRVDEILLADLASLDELLQSRMLPRAVSHGLIGKYVYLRYLRDRDILSDKKLQKWGLEHKDLFTRKARLSSFLKVNAELQEWLNGSVFATGGPLPDFDEGQLRLVAGVFFGDSPLSGRKVQQSLFDVYDFSHISIETLSCVYEQFLHDSKGNSLENAGASRGKTLGAYYTPLPLAEFVIAELNNRRALKPGVTVLDSACGSGVFLVQCYRRLIESQMRVQNRPLRPSELRELLTRNFFGIDKDGDACRVTELSLILTLLDYVEPPDLENTTFKLPRLREQNIFEGDFFETTGPVAEFLRDQKFDWIVGNPPWAEIKGIPEPEHYHRPAYDWMKQNAATFPTTGNQVAEAFAWKAGLHLTSTGASGLVLLAMIWFKAEGDRFRSAFFSRRRVWLLANFANLAYVLFAGRTQRPASVVFFESQPPDQPHNIASFAPFVVEQTANCPEQPNRRLTTWNIIVQDVREVDNALAANDIALTWKAAMWGSGRDRKVLDRLAKQFTALGSLRSPELGGISEGFQLRAIADGKTVGLECHPELAGKKKLNMLAMKQAGPQFAFDDSALDDIKEDEWVRTRGGLNGLKVSHPPHIIVDASRRFAIYSDQFIAIPARKVGIGGAGSDPSTLRALSLYLSSTFCKYHQFFHSPQWGIDESIADLKALKAIPIPPALLSSKIVQELTELQLELAALSNDRALFTNQEGRMDELLQLLDSKVFELLRLRKTERWLIEDFVKHEMEQVKGKVTPTIARSATMAEVQEYLSALRHCLDGFLSRNGDRRHKIEAIVDRKSVLVSISLVASTAAVEPRVCPGSQVADGPLAAAHQRIRRRHSQWVYFERSLRLYLPPTMYYLKPLQRLHWTRRRAVLDADDVIGETLTEGGENV